MKSFAIICIINIFPDNLSTILVAQEDNINANTALQLIKIIFTLHLNKLLLLL